MALGTRARVAAHGLASELPPRWEGRIYLREHAPADAKLLTHPAALGHAEELFHPVLHLANFALPPRRGDFGSGAVDRMWRGHVFMALLEYGPEEAHRPLFAALGVPRPRAHEFASSALQRRRPGQGGWQRFFTANDRALCLYVVLGALAEARERIPEIQEVLAGLRIGTR